jgi:hypothetical protein
MLRDANMLVPDAQQPPADQDNDRGDNGVPCPEDGPSSRLKHLMLPSSTALAIR